MGVDDKENFYFLDAFNHRILKFSKDDRFIKEIGSIGQGEKNLFQPAGVAVEKGVVYVLDNGGRKIKSFSVEGEYLADFEIEKAFGTDSLCVTDDVILASVKYKRNEDFNKHNLITIFGKNGKIIKSIGKIIKCQTYAGYLTFNTIFISAMDKTIFGTFGFYPVIFAYDINGKEIFYKNLAPSIQDIRELKEYAEEKGFDRPEYTKKEGKILTAKYCSGFALDSKNKHLYYATNNFTLNNFVVLKFNLKGEFIERIAFKMENKNFPTVHIFIDKKKPSLGSGMDRKKRNFI